MAPPTATLTIDSDWATFQLITEGATVQKIEGNVYPQNLIFTPKGVLFGQPNDQLKPQVVEFQFFVVANHPTVTFFTGKGDTGTTGPQGGSVSFTLANHVYTNTSITGDGLNIEGFQDAPLFNAPK